MHCSSERGVRSALVRHSGYSQRLRNQMSLGHVKDRPARRLLHSSAGSIRQGDEGQVALDEKLLRSLFCNHDSREYPRKLGAGIGEATNFSRASTLKSSSQQQPQCSITTPQLPLHQSTWRKPLYRYHQQRHYPPHFHEAF